jgi:hypothetical protein
MTDYEEQRVTVTPRRTDDDIITGLYYSQSQKRCILMRCVPIDIIVRTQNKWMYDGWFEGRLVENVWEERSGALHGAEKLKIKPETF